MVKKGADPQGARRDGEHQEREVVVSRGDLEHVWIQGNQGSRHQLGAGGTTRGRPLLPHRVTGPTYAQGVKQHPPKAGEPGPFQTRSGLSRCRGS